MIKTERKFLSSGCWVAVVALNLAGAVSFGQSVATRYVISPEMVVAVMQAHQLPTAGVEVRLSAPVTSLSDHPMLDIQEIKRTGDLSAQLRIACRTPHACLPFYVSATWAKGATADASIQALSSLDNRAVSSAAASHSPKNGRGQDAETAASMHTGTSATLLIEDKKVHIRMKVICLEDGAPGRTIRVATLDHKQSYKAEIIAPDLLKGSF